MINRAVVSLLAIGLGLSVGIGHYVWKSGASDIKAQPVAVPEKNACTPGQIELKSWQAKVENAESTQPGNYLRIAGEAVNHCLLSTGVSVRVTAKDAKGAVVESVVRRLGNFRNIPPGSYRFEVSAPFDYKPDMTSFELEVVEVRQWR